MKQFIALTLSILLLMALGAWSRQSDSTSVTGTPSEISSAVPQTESAQPQIMEEPPSESEPSEEDNGMASITITIDGSVYSAKLYDSETATVFLSRLPMTLNMSELNGNEKYYNLPDSLPTDSQRVGSINAGDLLLYGSDCLVLFYESFNTSYSYTKIGYIENVSGLAEILGRGSVDVTFTASD